MSTTTRHLAARMGTIGTESAFEVSARARALEAEGRSIVMLQIGEPDFDTPAHVREAAKRALDDGATHYAPYAGIPALREAIAADVTARKGFAADPSQVFVTVGGKGVMLYAILGLVDPGDEVLVPDPGYPIYESLTRFVGATPVPIPIRMERDFRLDVDELEALITPRTRALVVNSPANPTGGVLTRSDLTRIGGAGGPTRPVGPRRRDLQPDPVRRRRARLARCTPRDGRTDHRPRRVLEDVRDDGLATRLRGRADVPDPDLRPAGRSTRSRAPRRSPRSVRSRR